MCQQQAHSRHSAARDRRRAYFDAGVNVLVPNFPCILIHLNLDGWKEKG